MPKFLTALAFVLWLASPAGLAQAAPGDSTEVIVRGKARVKLTEDAVPPPLADFLQPPRIEHIALSDDGSRIAFVSTKNDLHILTLYNVNDHIHQSIRLSDDSLTAIKWLDNDHVLLSDTQTGIRGTCPSGMGQKFKGNADQTGFISAMSVSGFSGGSSESITNSDPILALQLADQLTPPACGQYGVRAYDAATIVDVRTGKGTAVGDKFSASEYDNMPLGQPIPVMIDGKMQLTGPFLELRDKSIGGQVAQRVYLWRMDPDTGRGQLIKDGGGDLDRDGSYVDDWVLDKAGQPIARTTYDYLDETFRIQVKKDGKWTPILTRKIDAKAHTFAPYFAGLGRDGQSMLILDAVLAPDGSRRFKYFELSYDGKLSEALDEDAIHDRPIFHPETKALAGFEHDGERPTYTFFDPELAEYYKLAVDTAPGQIVQVAAMARNPGQMIVFDHGGDDPGSWHYYDVDRGMRDDLGSQYPAVPIEWIASQRVVRYKASDGLEINALMTLPPKGEAKHRALVVLPHDGPMGHDARGYDWLAQSLASRGYVVLQPNYRGSDGYGTALTEAGYGQWSGRILSDINEGVAYMVAQGIADPKRVCIAGQGYGGYAALMASQAGRGTYRCAVSINGISDPDDYVNGLSKNALDDEMAPLKSDPKQPRSFVADVNSPGLARRYFGSQTPASIQAATVTLPVLLVHSQRDGIVPVQQSRRLSDDLQKAGKSATYTELPDCGHDLNTDACRLGAAQALIDFLKVNNPPK
ncbi:MAG: alpha/beta fold hydrolase [Asticcacaulis sp.]